MGEIIDAELEDFVKSHADDIVKEAAKNDLVSFASYIDPSLVLTDFHYTYYKILDMFIHGKIKKLMISVPPQHGKSEGSTRKTPAMLLGMNPDLKIVIGCYNIDTAKDFCTDVQRIMDKREYQELFPTTVLSRNEIIKKKGSWKRSSRVIECVGRKGSLRAVGRSTSLTSKSVDISILDDVYKDHAEANSPIIREKAWNWYTSVVRSRLHNESQELIVFTRWHNEDLIGKLEEIEQVIDVKKWSDLENIPFGAWVRINFEAIKTDEPTEIDPRKEFEVLFPERHNLKTLLLKRKLNKQQFDCLYQGHPGSAEGYLYTSFRTYTKKSQYGRFIRRGSYTDVADEGEDYLCTVVYDVYESLTEVDEKGRPIKYILIVDMYTSQENIRVTSITVPRMIEQRKATYAWIESNNGGSGFAFLIRKKTNAHIHCFRQSQNKESRIITNAGLVNYHVIFPAGWQELFPFEYNHLKKFLKKFNANAHDDLEDVLTGIVEKEIILDELSLGIKRKN